MGFMDPKAWALIFRQPPWLESKFINNMLSTTTKRIKEEALFTFFKKRKGCSPLHIKK
jgi:hypothetical protein